MSNRRLQQSHNKRTALVFTVMQPVSLKDTYQTVPRAWSQSRDQMPKFRMGRHAKIADYHTN